MRVREGARRTERTKGRAAARAGRGGRSREPGGQVRAGGRAEPRCRDGAQPGRAPALGPERQAERYPGPQPEPGPGRGSGPQGRAARSGGDRAPQWLRGFLPAPAGGWDPANLVAGERGDPPHHIQDLASPRKAGRGARIQHRAASPRGSAETSSAFRRLRPCSRHREDALFSLPPLRDPERWVPRPGSREPPPEIPVITAAHLKTRRPSSTRP